MFTFIKRFDIIRNIDKNERQKMKFEDARVGMGVVDRFGNEYVIIALEQSRTPVRLRCIKHNKICYVDEHTRFYGVDDEWWIVDSEENYNEFANYDVDISLESIKLKCYTITG